jgi:hypothetical protein
VTGGTWRDGFVEPTEVCGTKFWDFRLYGVQKQSPKRRTCARYRLVLAKSFSEVPHPKFKFIKFYVTQFVK